MWLMGSAPYLGGGFGHFYAYAPERWQYPIDRYTMEAKRQLDVLDRRLADNNGWPEMNIPSPTWLPAHGMAPWYRAIFMARQNFWT